MKKWLRSLLAVLTLAALLTTSVVSLAEELPYITYNYDYWDDVVYTPAAYVPGASVTGGALRCNGEPVGAFRNPQDLCVAPDGDVYLADTGNNRVIVLDSSMRNVRRIITGFDNAGVADSFSSPTGVAVSQKGQLYVADSMNHRVVVLEKDGALSRIVENPTSEVLEEGYVFTPLKVSVDYADRIYCIAQNMFEGIMVFETNGAFTGFFGTIQVKISLWEKFWRKLATKEERSKQQLFIPTEFTGIDIDDEGFVYASNVDSDGIQAVRRLNPRGQDVIRKGVKQNLGGDLWINSSSQYGGPSKIVDVVYRGKGIYSLLDSKRGRVFTYDHEGNLLYIFGGLGTQAGTFNTPVAIEYAHGRVLVLDAYQSAILSFEETEYGALINEAVGLRFDGDEAQAVPLWERVLTLDENNELANTGIGKAYLSAGDNEKAMTYLKRGMNRSYYSVAYKRHRNEALKENITLTLSGGLALVVLLVVFFKVIKPRLAARKERRAQG